MKVGKDCIHIDQRLQWLLFPLRCINTDCMEIMLVVRNVLIGFQQDPLPVDASRGHIVINLLIVHVYTNPTSY